MKTQKKILQLNTRRKPMRNNFLEQSHPLLHWTFATLFSAGIWVFLLWLLFSVN